MKVGLIYPDTGPLAGTFTSVRAGLEARFGVANAAGGVEGRKLSYDWGDDQGNPATNGVVSRSMVEDRKVFAVIESTPVSSGGAAYLAAQQIPVIGIAVERVWTQYRNMFTYGYGPTSLSSQGTVTTFGKYAREHGGTHALLVTDPAGIAVSSGIARQLQASFEAAGITVTPGSADENPTPGQIAEITRQLVTGKADILASTLTTATFAQIVATVRQQGAQPKVILSGSQTMSSELLQKYGALLAGYTTYNADTGGLAASPALTAYRSAITRYAPELPDADQTLAQIGYTFGDMLIRGLQEAGACPTRNSFITGLRAVRNYTAGGLIPSFDFDRDFGKVAVCYPFVAVNATGTGLDVVNPDYCGERISN
ncbi:ABC transporter substrate-binding protein [Frankia sp. R82]|uniref:ABC transporter substrate-binding protein n=1 Tax=Frankia sp. R82 TaxID=2950553 RepID=UPI002044A59A|nr:ABC transporter substrate-binding protein [Frankia sp. R82]MCM3886882.1 ABC transporter substrate-binding protein [Frankia sp. R82]